jgi:hypothetical protein
MVSRSPAPVQALPASMMASPAPSSCRAMSAFSAGENETPGACSPSRSVVSSIATSAVWIGAVSSWRSKSIE